MIDVGYAKQNNIRYIVTGRYMNGTEVKGYHFLGEDNSESAETKERTIFLIEQGLIVNMRLQKMPKESPSDPDRWEPRGKGVNLNNLPVVNFNKNQYGNNEASQAAANSNVKARGENASPMSQYEITRPIMAGRDCVGYEVKTPSGKLQRLSKQKVQEMAKQYLLRNAIWDNSANCLRGKGVNIKQLDTLIMNSQGKIIDPKLDKVGMTVRVALMKHGGMVTNTINGRTYMFNAGDFIIVNPNADIEVVLRAEFNKLFAPIQNVGSAICDNRLDDKLVGIKVEMYGGNATMLTPAIVKRWQIVKYA